MSEPTMTCPSCGTMHDAWAVDVSDFVPPVGDGCELCMPELDDEDGDG